MSSSDTLLTLDTAVSWARSGIESDKVYQFIFLHPEYLFTIPNNRSWSIAHQIVYNGDVNLLGSILGFYHNDQIDIRTLSKDRKTLLDIAQEQSKVYPAMYTYVEHLFQQDDLIKAAKTNDWRSVIDILNRKSKLTNEKPPYSAYFLLHYVIQNGNKELLENLLESYQFELNVFSTDHETPADMAKRLKKAYMYLLVTTGTGSLGFGDSRRGTPLPPKNPLKENLTCILMEEIFIYPVIASDGQTYEREAITEWVNLYKCSPKTGAPMTAVFTDNIEIKRIIQSMETSE